MKTISIINNKGGVGKTTTTQNLGYEFSQHFGKKVVLLDLDPQANLTRFFKADESIPTIAHVLIGEAQISEVIQNTGYANLDIIPASEELKDVCEMLDFEGAELVLRNALEAIKGDYDFCIIDNAPALGISTDNALIASDEVIVPLCLDTYGFWGLDKIMRDIEKARQVNPDLYFNSCLITRYTNDETSAEVIRQMKEQDVYPVADTPIRETPKMREANFAGQPITENSIRSGASVDYRRWAKKYIENDRAND